MTARAYAIVPLAELKGAMGITTNAGDTDLAALERRMSEWVEGQVKRRFQEPTEIKDLRPGLGRFQLYLSGHADSTDEDAITVRERPCGTGSNAWVDVTAFERRGDKLLRTDGTHWLRGYEYEMTYDDGYDVAPGDIKDLVIELCQGEVDASAEQAGILKESIGDYSYELDPSMVVGARGLTDTATGTLNRWRKKLV